MQSGTWTVGERIGDQSGMGQVFRATRGEETCAIKMIDEAGPQVRDILANKVPESPYVVPILESCEKDGKTFLRMPLAEYSLGSFRKSQPGETLTVDETIHALHDIAAGLADIGHQVTHRDIKPDNVLWYNSRWCLTDFGLARIADATTATATRKGYRTPPFWAPELILGGRASEKSDIYALGVTAFLLLTGKFPFADANPQSEEDVKQWHLQGTVPRPKSGSSPLDSLVVRMLMKAPEARPTARDVREKAETIANADGPKFEAMGQLHDLAAERDLANAEADRQRAEGTTREEQRHRLSVSANSLADMFMSNLKDNLESVSGIERRETMGETIYRLGQGTLLISPMESVREIPEIPFDVVSAFSMTVEQDTDAGNWNWNGRSHSLWFCDVEEEGVYDWYETAFHRVFGGQRPRINPYARTPLDADAQSALSPAISSVQVARKFFRIDDEHADEFVNRWIEYFAQAAQGGLYYPALLPEGEKAVWRR